MDLKTKISMEIVKGEGDKKNDYLFIMPYGCPLGEAYDACHEALARVVEMSQKAAEQAKQKVENKKEN